MVLLNNMFMRVSMVMHDALVKLMVWNIDNDLINYYINTGVLINYISGKVSCTGQCQPRPCSVN